MLKPVLGRREVGGAWGLRGTMRPGGEERGNRRCNRRGSQGKRRKLPWGSKDHEHVAMRAGLVKQKQFRQLTGCVAGKQPKSVEG